MVYLIEDDMKKESKRFIIPIILGYTFAILMFFVPLINNDESFTKIDIILICAFCFIIASISLYGLLYGTKYKIQITADKVFLKTLFKKAEVNLKEVTNYTCKRYGKSVFYQFRLYSKERSVLLNTRYKEELKRILSENSIEEK